MHITMKASITLALGAVAIAASVPDIPSDINECGRGCIKRMIADTSLGCSAGDASCLCTKAAFGYGLRDCGHEACTEPQPDLVTKYGIDYCVADLGSATGAAIDAINGKSNGAGSPTKDTKSSHITITTTQTTTHTLVGTGSPAKVPGVAAPTGHAAGNGSSSATASATHSTSKTGEGVAQARIAAPLVGLGALAVALLIL